VGANAIRASLVIVGIILLALAGCLPSQTSQKAIKDPESWLKDTVNGLAASKVHSVQLNGTKTFYPSIRLVPASHSIEDLNVLLAEAAALYQALFEVDQVENVEVIWLDEASDLAGELLYVKLKRQTFEQIDWEAFNPATLPSVADQYELKG